MSEQLPDLPNVVREAIFPPAPHRVPVEPVPFNGTLTRYAERALEQEIADLRAAVHPGRHPRLVACALALFELVHGGALPEDLVVREIWSACDANALVAEGREQEIEDAIAYARKKAASNPRRPDSFDEISESPRAPEPHARGPVETEDEDPVPDEPEWIRENMEHESAVTEAAPAAAGEARDQQEIPELPAACWRYGFAEFREAYSQSTEASDGFLWGGYFVVAGLVLGRDARLRCGVEVFPNVYLTNVGESGRSRKSTAQAYARKLLARVHEGVEHSLGIGSPEGLLGLLAGRDGQPKRVLVDLGETVTLLRKGASEATRGLLPFVTALYDCPPSARLPTRKDPLDAPEPFLSILGSSTAEWLRGSLAVEDVHGGLGGRFVYMVGKEKAPIAFPPPPVLEALEATEQILRGARDRHSTLREYPLTPEALRFWENWYMTERSRKYETPILDCLAQRLHVTAWKVALVYAAIEDTPAVGVEQIEAACAFADYQRSAQAHVLGSLGDSEAAKLEERIKAALRKNGPLAGWKLAQRIRHVDAGPLARAVRGLGRLGSVEERKRGRGTVWALVEGSQ